MANKRNNTSIGKICRRETDILFVATMPIKTSTITANIVSNCNTERDIGPTL